MIPGISLDKISDLTTNILRGELVKYTHSQCELHGVDLQQAATGPIFNLSTMRWEQQYVKLPVWRNVPFCWYPRQR
jgi:hypothetical protein